MKKYSILSGDKIQYRMISEAIQLDRVSYDDVYQLQVDTCLDYFEKNKDIYIMAVNPESGTVVGYVNFSPIRGSVYADIVSGSVVDTVITGDDVLPYEDGSPSEIQAPWNRHANASVLVRICSSTGK